MAIVPSLMFHDCPAGRRLCRIPGLSTSSQEPAMKGKQGPEQDRQMRRGKLRVLGALTSGWRHRIAITGRGEPQTQHWAVYRNYSHFTWIRWIYYEFSSPALKLLLCEESQFCQRRVLGKNLHMAGDVIKAQFWLWQGRCCQNAPFFTTVSSLREKLLVHFELTGFSSSAAWQGLREIPHCFCCWKHFLR